MTDPWTSTRTEPGAADALLGATHGDPFALLGWHEVAPGTHVVRCLRPGASRIAVLDAAGVERGVLAPLRDGLFAGRADAPAGRFPYRPARHDGRVVDDPYRFGFVLGELDLHLLAQGTHWRAWRTLGANARTIDGVAGTAFAVWAPNARRVSVVGDFNGWDGRVHAMRRRVEAGVWELFVPGVDDGARYKFEVLGAGGELLLKGDPYARLAEPPPATASRERH
ncbi:MAG TPA: 1,4-alpha-glucan branching enzyme, partial [Burkholderiaceae bacterium]|nr:1,4-alpha-glucan branching enzyme [Burkholderiaceae bacterium]